MESYRMLQISIISVITSVTPLIQSQNIPTIKGLDCFTDFDQTMVCIWELVNSSSDCSKDFNLKYTDDFNSTKIYNNACGAVKDDDFNLPTKCICNTSVEPLTVKDKYEVQVLSQGKCVDQIHFSVKYKVKPKPPVNVHVDLSEVEIGRVYWNVNNRNFLENELCYDVEILSKTDRKKALDRIPVEGDRSFRFTKRELNRGYEYTVRVRSKPSTRKNAYFKGTWSEWSAEAEWKNDYTLTFWDVAGTIITVSCFLVLILIISSYYFIVRWREQWWDIIPDPAKSSLTTCKLLQNQNRMPNERSKTTSLWERLKSFPKAHPKPQQDRFINMHYNLREDSTLQKFTLEPENDVVVSSFELCSPEEEDQSSSSQEHISENRYEAGLLGSDLSIGQMFSDILHDSSATMMGTSENSDIGNIFWGFPKQETHVPPSEVFPEMDYRGHYYSDECSLEDLRRIDSTNPPYKNLDEDCSVGITDSCTIGEGGTFINTGYSSFASAVSKDA